MLARLFLLFTLIPLVELYLLLWLGRLMGLMPTLGMILFTGALGAWLARSQGLATWTEIQRQQAQGKMPTTALVDGLLILIAGAVLLTPGLLTDVAGFFLLIPAGRAMIRGALYRRLEAKVKVQRRQSPQVIIVDDFRTTERAETGSEPS